MASADKTYRDLDYPDITKTSSNNYCVKKIYKYF